MIKQFEQIYQCNIISRYTGFLENIERRITTSDGRSQLTKLQEKALKSEKFWYKPEGGTRNLIIQGATSSGKTMLAELLAMQCIANNRKAIYLVPLRALIEEKRKKFDNDMKTGDDWRKVYGSSSDYQDHDMELMEGDYDLAVIVYEKFFALLAEPSNLLKDCSLIVVDEMQLLSAPDRGPKLEYAITKVRKQYSYSNKIRILGLTTADSQTKYVEKWLDADVIRELARPVRLRERIIALDGTYWERIVPGSNDIPLEKDTSGTASNPIKGHLEGIGNHDTKEEFLCALLKKIYSDNPKKKTIVFASSRRGAASLAKKICESRVLGQQAAKASEQIINEIAKIDFYDEKDAQRWKNLLLPMGVAYHNAALAMSMREMIEEEFRKENGAIRLIVATETLMIGVNLPADIIILFDDSVPRRSDETSGINSKPLNIQEYRNFIGRCGRLGITDNEGGESYLIARDVRDLRSKWTNYVNEKQETIQSALENANANINDKALSFTPYFLNLLCRGNNAKFRMNDVIELLYSTLSYHEKKDATNEVQEIAREIVNILKKRKMAIESEFDPMDFNLDGIQSEDSQYATNEFGITMAPYALSVRTCWEIYVSFFLAGFEEQKYAGLPISYTGKNLLSETADKTDNGFLLDILYRICSMNEVSNKIKYPGLPEKTAKNGNNQNIFSQLRKTVKDFLRKYEADEKSFGHKPFWDNSRLEIICNDTEDNISNKEIETALRAILLKYWLEKKLMKEIRSEINLPSDRYSLDAGDFDRLGEVCAFIIEAVANCFHASGKRVEALWDNKGHGLDQLKYSFLNLASAIKYGMDDPELLKIAKMNIPGLGRKTIIELGEMAKKEGYESTLHFITSRGKTLEGYLKKEQLRRLRESNKDLHYKQEIERLYGGRLLPERLYDALRSLTTQGKKEEWEKSVDDLISGIQSWPSPLKNSHGIDVGRTINHEDGILFVAYLYIEKEEELLKIDHINDLLESIPEKEQGKVVIISNVDAGDELQLAGVSFETNWGMLTSTQLCMYMIELANKSSLVKFDPMITSSNSYVLFHVLAESTHQAIFKRKTAISETVERLLQNAATRNDASKSTNEPFGTFVEDIGSGANGQVSLYQKNQPGHKEKFACKIILIPNDNCQTEVEQTSKELRQYFLQNDIHSLKDKRINNVTKEYYKSKANFDQKYIEAIPEAIETLKENNLKEDEINFSLGISCYIQGMTYFKEAEIIKGLSAAPNVIRIKSVNEEFFWNDGNPQCKISIWMDCMDGNLEALLQIPEWEIIQIGISMCNALSYCHAKGILHRDIKPQNILYKENDDKSREYYISDFGSASRKGTKTITGTPRFIPPEVSAGQGWSERGDIYSLGVTLKDIFGKRNHNPELHQILEKASNQDIRERFQNMDDFKYALEQFATKRH